MAITTYAELKSAVRDWLGRTNDTTQLTDARVDDVIRLAEADIYERLRVREMETSADITINAQTVALPAGVVGWRRLYLAASPIVELDYMAPPQFWGRFADGSTGKPWAFTLEGDNVVFGPAPDATYTGKMLFYKRLDALSGAVNALFTRQPDLWLYGALAHAAQFTRDEAEAGTWRQAFATALDRAETSNERARWGGAPLVMRAG